MIEYCKKAELKVDYRLEVVKEGTIYNENCIPKQDHKSPVNDLLTILIQNKCLIMQDDWSACARAASANILPLPTTQLSTFVTITDVISSIKRQLLLR